MHCRRLCSVLALPTILGALSADVAADVLLKNENPNVVSSNPTGGNPQFALRQVTVIDSIFTYHYNGGAGKPAGQLWLVGGPNNQKYGPWTATISSKFYWTVSPKLTLPAGTYTVFDSDPATWSFNPASRNQGFVQVHGTPTDLNALSSFEDVKGKVAGLASFDRARVLDSLAEDRKGPVKSHFGIVPKPSVTVDKTRIRAASAEFATLRLNNPFPKHQYTAILVTPTVGTLSWRFRDGIAQLPAAFIVNGYPLRGTATLTIKVIDSTTPQEWSAYTDVATVTLTVSP